MSYLPSFQSYIALVGLLLSVVMRLGASCGEQPQKLEIRAEKDDHPNLADSAVLSPLLSQYPIPVSVSPNGQYLLLKYRHKNSFELNILDRKTGQIVGSDSSADTQLSLTWHPNSKTIVFLEAQGGNRRFHLYEFSLATGKRRLIPVPATGSAAPPLQWSPSGEELAYLDVGQYSSRLLIIDLHQSLDSVGSPRIIATNLSPTTDFKWSPNGTSIATVLRQQPGHLVILNVHTGSKFSIPVVSGGEVRHIAWSPEGDALLVTARRAQGEHFTLLKVDLETSAIEAIIAPEVDVAHPVWLDGGLGYLYHTVGNGQTILHFFSPKSDQPFQLSPTLGVTRALPGSAKGGYVYAIHTGNAAPPALYALPLDTKLPPQVLYASKALQLPRIPPTAVTLSTMDGFSIPALVWHAPRAKRDKAGVLIWVHGGPHIEQSSMWNSGFQLMLDQGLDVIAVNYRGSSGYGATYESAGDDLTRILDLEAGVQYAHDVLGASPNAIILAGSSYGTRLATLTASRHPELGCLVLISTVPIEVPEEELSVPRCLLVFHGENDNVYPPERARSMLESVFGANIFNDPNHRWHEISHEGHFFHRSSTWALVYGAIFRNLPSLCQERSDCSN